MKKYFLFAFILIQTGCALFLSQIRDKKASTSETTSAQVANQYMWDMLHLGHYDSIPSILEKLQAAYSFDPHDVKVTAHLGFTYLWAFSERLRNPDDERIFENVVLANRFFKEALELNPGDHRIRGFQAATDMCEGALSENYRQLVMAYFKGRKAIRKWPQFNKFAMGYVGSQLDTGTRMFRQALRYQWEIIDDCSKEKLDEERMRKDPSTFFLELQEAVRTSEDLRIKRACGNSWIAPHNWEGFFLNFGDMLVKAGRLEEAREVYMAAKHSPAYNDWVYQPALEARIANLEKNKEAFNRKINLFRPDEKNPMMINSEFSCSACHRMSAKEFKSAGYQEPGNEIYFLSSR